MTCLTLVYIKPTMSHNQNTIVMMAIKWSAMTELVAKLITPVTSMVFSTVTHARGFIILLQS